MFNSRKLNQKLPISVVLITLNEAHNLKRCLPHLQDWAGEVHILDSYSCDDTVDVALQHGAFVHQRNFDNFGNQWNAALKHLHISFPWTMKLDPDEIITSELKKSIERALFLENADGFSFDRRLLFMGKKLPIKQEIVRIWRTGYCSFTAVNVNEHPIVKGKIEKISGQLLHYDSPNLDHWFSKQNLYSTAEAYALFKKSEYSYPTRLLGSKNERRMWLKKHIHKMPFRYFLLFFYYFCIKGAWKAGRVGYIWARLRSDIIRYREYKCYEMTLSGKGFVKLASGIGDADLRAHQISSENIG